MTKYSSIFVLFTIAFVLYFINYSFASPYPSIGNGQKTKRLDLFGGYDILGVCLKNCAQCKKMFGNFFEGERCANNCVKLKGKVIPDCEDLASIAPFLSSKLE
ncbi:hypothetical protein PVAND_010146 [Polypedilum vanderplanki]|uniref:Eclosion hormone n=1 Tax=Polypedilum vanderplanki TaxID=319348 RepID=A0A9J6CEZ2_POLVA|nr:hypothetical protein PVAND_010146 [Polypedilum vanderplanki]